MPWAGPGSESQNLTVFVKDLNSTNIYQNKSTAHNAMSKDAFFYIV